MKLERDYPGLSEKLHGRKALVYGVSGPLATPFYSKTEVCRLIAHAYDAGLSIFDTAPSYGAGEAERRLGEALKKKPDAFVMTKAGVNATGFAKRVRDFSPSGIKKSVEMSLARLGRERIDLLWLHGVAQGEVTEELERVIEQLSGDGKVAFCGATSRDTAFLRACDTYPFSAYMVPVNALVGVRNEDRSAPILFGIECFANLNRSERQGASRSAVWKALKSLRQSAGFTKFDTPQMSMLPTTAAAALSFAFNDAGCDFVVTTTTRKKRIEENADLCKNRVYSNPY